MKSIFSIFVIASLLYACSSSNAETGNAQSTAKKADDGEKVYKTYCVTCHGIYGDMGGSGAFDLKKSKLTLEERINVISNGRNLMTPFKELLNDEKIKAVAKYIESLRTEQ